MVKRRVAREEQEVDDSGREQSTAPTAGRQKQSRGSSDAGRKKGEEWSQGLFCKNRETQGLY
jgi:hypothetical protein